MLVCFKFCTTGWQGFVSWQKDQWSSYKDYSTLPKVSKMILPCEVVVVYV